MIMNIADVTYLFIRRIAAAHSISIYIHYNTVLTVEERVPSVINKRYKQNAKNMGLSCYNIVDRLFPPPLMPLLLLPLLPILPPAPPVPFFRVVGLARMFLHWHLYNVVKYD